MLWRSCSTEFHTEVLKGTFGWKVILPHIEGTRRGSDWSAVLLSRCDVEVRVPGEDRAFHTQKMTFNGPILRESEYSPGKIVELDGNGHVIPGSAH